MRSLCIGLGQHEASASPSSVKFCPLSTCTWAHKSSFKCRLCIDYALVHHCLNLYKVLIWAWILIFLILSEHLAVTLLSREGLLSLSCWREVDVQRYFSTRLCLRKSSMAKRCSRCWNSVSFSSGCVSYVREGYSERAYRENYIDQNVVSVLFCPHLHYITVLWPRKPFPQRNVPSGPSVLEGRWPQSRSFEMDLGLLSFGHWQCRAVQWVPSFLCIPP